MNFDKRKKELTCMHLTRLEYNWSIIIFSYFSVLTHNLFLWLLTPRQVYFFLYAWLETPISRISCRDYSLNRRYSSSNMQWITNISTYFCHHILQQVLLTLIVLACLIFLEIDMISKAIIRKVKTPSAAKFKILFYIFYY
jgi:hypothetical protein